jgi:hypothetical protein
MIVVPVEGSRGAAVEMVSIGSVDLEDANASIRVHPMTDEPLDLDKHRGMAAQKAVDLRRVLAEAENHARELRHREAVIEQHLLTAAATSWPEAAAKARYLLNLYAASLPEQETRHRALIDAVFDDFVRLAGDG